ncbi:hypothetical protein JCM16303_007434 [Sporobolomyces ruberrimus]
MDSDPPSYLQASLSSPLMHPTPTASSPRPQRNPAFEHSWSQFNLPTGMFLLQNRAQGKSLDVLSHHSNEGAILGVHPVKQPILKGLSLQHSRNNQLFFLDWNGHLYSASASRPVDISSSSDELVISHPHPIQTYASAFSHPLPRFFLDPTTSTLQVLFSHDPTYPPPLNPNALSESSYDEYDYLVETVPLRKKRNRPSLVRPLLRESTGDVAKKASEVVYNGIEGFLGRVGGLNPFASGGGGVSTESSSSTTKIEQKRLPRTRDASLPPPPIPTKDDQPLPPHPPREGSSPSFPGAHSPRSHRNASVSISPTQLSPHLAQPSSPRVNDPSRRPSTAQPEEEDDPEEEAFESDDEPSAFRPVRIIKLVRSSNWRENDFPFNKKPIKVTPTSTKPEHEDEEEESPLGPIGLGFRDTRRVSEAKSGGQEEGDGEEELGVENVWPETLGLNHHARETSFASTSTCIDPSVRRGSEEESEERRLSARKKRKEEEMREMRKWRRRQWDVVPVRIEPQEVPREGASYRVKHQLEEEMYAFEGELSDGLEEQDRHGREGEVLEDREDEEMEEIRGRASVAVEGKRGSIETAKSVVSGVGSFITTRLLWGSGSTSSTPQAANDSRLPFRAQEDEEEGDLPPLPTTRDEDERDAQEVKSDELEKLGQRNRRKSSLLRTSGVASPPLPDFPSVPTSSVVRVDATEVPLPESVPNTPQISISQDSASKEGNTSPYAVSA